jgi:alpha-methylacyl-CoA racemase
MGPLRGVKVLEIAGIGPAPYCATLLSDLGAEVLRVDRPQAVRAALAPELAAEEDPIHQPGDLLSRGRRSAAVDLKQPAGVEVVLRLAERADVLIEGFRPGVTERLGLGPEVCLARNPRLVYGRMTGWGQEGPLARAAGHDINYIALAGALHPIGRPGEPPPPPLNLVGDFGGGGLLLAFGVVCALVERAGSGRGQVVDAAMVDGAAHLMTFIHGMRQMGLWSDVRGANLLDGAAPFYDSYETRDGRYVSIGPIERPFYELLLEKLGLAGEELPRQYDRGAWPGLKERLREIFRSKTRDEWCALLEGSDVCFAPVLSLAEAPAHPHLAARRTFVEAHGQLQPAPAPRFSRTPGAIQGPPARPGEHTDAALSDWGFDASEIAKLRESRAIA